MGTALIYLVVLLGVAAAFFLGASAIFGRGEELAPLPEGSTPTQLPETGEVVGGDDVRGLRFQQAVRGYKMAEVDWVLERLATELDQSYAELNQAQTELNQARGALYQAQAELDQLRGELSEARGKLNNAQAELTDARAELSDARGRVAELETAVRSGGGR